MDLLAGGVPCPPFLEGGQAAGEDDDRDLFPTAIRLVDEIRPKAVMLENVRGLLDAVFDDYRNKVEKQLIALGYTPGWKLLNASGFGVSQLRPRVVFVAIKKELAEELHVADGTGRPSPQRGGTASGLDGGERLGGCPGMGRQGEHDRTHPRWLEEAWWP